MSGRGRTPDMPASVRALVSMAGIPIFVPQTDDYLGAAIAEAAAYACGGGIVQYKPVTYAWGGNTMPLRRGVKHIGAGCSVSAGELLNGGTIILGDGTAAAFAYNATDLGAPLANLPTFLGYFISGAEVSRLAIKNVTYGVRGGGLYNPSFWHCKFSELHIEAASQWGFFAENFITCDFNNIFIKDSANSAWFVQSGTTILNCGNSRIDRIFSNFPTAKGAGRGVVIGARGGSDANDLQIRNITTCSNNITSTQACTMSNGSADIGVPDISKFGVGMAVYFSGNANGVYTPAAYFVTQVSGTSGAGTFRIIDGAGNDTPIVMTGNAAVNVTTKGYGGLELGGLDTTSRNTHCSLTGVCDIEAGGTARVVLRGSYCCNYDFGLIGGTESRWHVVERKTSQCRVNSLQPYLSVDTQAGTDLFWVGTYPQELKAGSTLAFVGTSGFNLSSRNGRDMIGQLSGLPLKLQRSMGLAQVFYSASGTVDDNSGDVIVFNGAAGQTLTLAAVASNNVGMVRYVTNQSANAVTVATSSSQTISGAGSSGTSISVAANTTVRLVSVDKTGAGSYGWAVLT